MIKRACAHFVESCAIEDGSNPGDLFVRQRGRARVWAAVRVINVSLGPLQFTTTVTPLVTR